MKNRTILNHCLLGFAVLSSSCLSKKDNKKEVPERPNVVIIFLDDSGFSDFEPFQGSENITPNVSKLAKEGTVFTNFRVPQAICSASRAALMTGCYPGRTKVFGAHAPREKGLDPEFAILSEQLKLNGYATGFYGKWHLGDQPETRPHNRGFDKSAGLMYSNDMWKHHPSDPEFWGKYPLSYWENGEISIEDVDSSKQKMLSKWSTEFSLNFIEEHKDEPFFLYLAYSMPHVPIFCSDEFEGKSGKGLYGDVIMELDDGIGRLLHKLKDLGLDENTMIVFTSDNGPWSVYGNHAGRTPFKEAKATSFDGGLKSALIVKFPGRIPKGETSDKFLYSIDLFPTICALTNSPLPENEIDGENIDSILTGESDMSYKRPYYAFSTGTTFEGVFSSDGRWKLHLPHGYRSVREFGNDGKPGKYDQKNIELTLYDLQNDPYETIDVKDKYPEILENLLKNAELHKSRFYSN
ncbi:MAG: sulfatase-like hydrolase/transferase [Bacteroidales bacterium]|nr:sulfatase-like hydrolase/transferase [Bacteroidales bacterium]